MFWLLKRTISLRRFFYMFWLRSKKNDFQLHTLICRPANRQSCKSIPCWHSPSMEVGESTDQMLDWTFIPAFLSSADFFKINLFKKFFQEIRSECQTVWIWVRRDVLLGLILVQTVCQSYQQTTLLNEKLKSDHTYNIVYAISTCL